MHVYFLFYFILFCWTRLNPCELGEAQSARPDHCPSPLPLSKQEASAKVIKLPSHSVHVTFQFRRMQNEMRTGVPASGDDEDGCS
jgi:hypothetical protein